MKRAASGIKVKQSRTDTAFTVVNYVFLSLILIVILYPLVYVVSSSLSSASSVIAGSVWLFPDEFNLEGYKAVFKHRRIISGFANSVFYMVAGTTINVVCTVLAAYPLSRRDFAGRNIFTFLLVFTMMFSGGLIPEYLLVKSLNMLDTRWAMLIPGAISVWNVIITRTFFVNTIPNELLEAAQMDGCSDFKFFGKIVLPLSAAILAVNALFYAIGHWNSYFNAMIYLSQPELFPLQIILRDVLIQNELDPSQMAMYDVKDAMAKDALRVRLKYSLIVVASVPVLCIYPFVQKYFVKGLMIGSVKG